MRVLSGVYVALFSSMVLFLVSCVDPTDLGSSLLENDRAEVSFFDTLTLNAQTVPGRAQFVFGPDLNQQADSYLWGQVKDPIFGVSNSEIYIQPRLEFFNPNFSDSKLDSIVLILPYDRDTTAYYGNIDQPFEMNVFRVTDAIERNEFHFSDTSFIIDPQAVGNYSFVPRPRDSLNFINITGTAKDTFLLPGFLSIPLDTNFGNQILQADSLDLDNDENFFNFLGGLLLDPVSENEGFLSFDLKNGFAGIYVYYTVNDTVNRQFQIGLDQFSSRLPVFSHDYTEAFVESFINNESKGDSLIFVQSLAGLDTRIEMPFVQNLDGLLINKAELILQLENLDQDQPDIFTPALQLGLFTEQSAETLAPITDFTLADISNNVPGLFGGSYDETTGIYTLNFSDHFQRMISGEASNFLFISAFPKAERAYRAVFKGISDNGIKVRVTFSKLQ